VGKSASLFTPGSHGTTFGGNPISCAAANAVIDEIESKKMLALNASKGALIRNLISPIRGVKEARGRGLLIGIVVENGKAKEIAARLLELGFLVNATNDDVVRIAPAFVVSQKQIMSFVRAFADACEEVYGG
jgi:acetylornithine aminotransferase